MFDTSSREIKSYFFGILKITKITQINPNKNCVIGFGITEKSIKNLNQLMVLLLAVQFVKKITKSIAKKTKSCHKCFNKLVTI